MSLVLYSFCLKGTFYSNEHDIQTFYPFFLQKRFHHHHSLQTTLKGFPLFLLYIHVTFYNQPIQNPSTPHHITPTLSKDYRFSQSAKINNISDPNKIYPDQIIKINGSSNISPTTYVVKKGDTLSKIASKYGVDWQYLYEKNKQVIGNNPDKIYPGQVLSI